MPWKEITTMSARTEFIEDAKSDDANISQLCRQYGISRKTGYKWLKREQKFGLAGLVDKSRRPHHSPNRTAAMIESQVLEVRKKHRAWGGRKIRKILQNKGYNHVPTASTITAILHRHQQIDPEESQKHQPMQRFEKELPNELWQMDFKGYFALEEGGYCHPLTVLDDHSRFLVGLKACPNKTIETVQAQLTSIFQRFGLPERMLMDNGSAWGFDREARHTLLTAWLIRLGIAISHGRPYHPQTQGKEERLNRTLTVEVLQQNQFNTLQDSQEAFDEWWQIYNYIRPHEALELLPPASRYIPSSRPFPTILPPITYQEDDIIRKVDLVGKIYFHGSTYRISAAFRHQPVALRPTNIDGQFSVFFCKQKVAQIDLHHDNC
ncbi:MAG: IS481 family transposase [Anaerolineae bacterium]|nr:IS481 family transposase [Anaerolineae bacterium]